MHSAKKWAVLGLLVATLGTVAVVCNLPVSSSAQAQPAPGRGDHWRNFDGHWSYWHEGDRRWYYTDGTHWFFHDGLHWVLYPFDRAFGRTGFEHGGYRAPGPAVQVNVPLHDVFRHL